MVRNTTVILLYNGKITNTVIIATYSCIKNVKFICMFALIIITELSRT